MHQGKETKATEKLLQQMLQTEKESFDDESCDLVIGMLFQHTKLKLF